MKISHLIVSTLLAVSMAGCEQAPSTVPPRDYPTGWNIKEDKYVLSYLDIEIPCKRASLSDKWPEGSYVTVEEYMRQVTKAESGKVVFNVRTHKIEQDSALIVVERLRPKSPSMLDPGVRYIVRRDKDSVKVEGMEGFWKETGEGVDYLHPVFAEQRPEPAAMLLRGGYTIHDSMAYYILCKRKHLCGKPGVDGKYCKD